MNKQVKGKVIFFNDAKGYGFLKALEADHIFVHYSAIVGDGFKTLSEEQDVTFELVMGPKGPQAMSVVKIES